MNKKKKELDEIYKDILVSAQVLKKLTVVRDEVIVMIGVKNRQNQNDENINNGGNNKEESIIEIKSEDRRREAENNKIRQIKFQFDQNLMELEELR